MSRVLVVVGVACFALGLIGCKGSSSGGKEGKPVGADEMKAKQAAGTGAMKAGTKMVPPAGKGP